jgi:hypothetical protein
MNGWDLNLFSESKDIGLYFVQAIIEHS